MLFKLITVIQQSSAVIALQPARQKEILKILNMVVGNALAEINAQELKEKKPNEEGAG
ncbi:hypothetical protein QYF52_16860 [Paenibacillus polymyxa]|uniref:hypothetical protein n=1 Tax=Paenibacillus polymyxa TaxID=1406 RepID=UPI0025B64463|nr:hypothetical protein [Paenibacillus polymyxa]MDN4079615.1 hypothetical protein [Paenibacillus polymyxa]MDN4105037.1 hypothetical protein [Paenibacillus polymyxa]MDN4114926.1 hypothetical protein [Paenibacillus polymyxa]